ncbi:MAG: hypothetical protein JW915_23375 [Chitinispirillaceae bacterium]|nr:hypothetical protein [Chitinispirillaceae bacterium]
MTIRSHKISMISLSVISVLFITCQHFTNPFDRLENADIHITENTTFATQWVDTLDIFSNDTLYLAATVPELIDSYTVTIPNNRDFQKKTVIKPRAAAHPFRISVYATGDQRITIDVFRNDGKPKPQNILFYAKNPLRQENLLECDLNDSITLSTDPVQDSKVIYTWILDHQIIRSPYSNERIRAYQMDNRIRSGRLYVSDSVFKSSETTFEFSFIDNIPPVITCDGLDKSTKIIRTADSIFLLSVHIDDGYEQPVSTVEFNNTLYEPVSNNIYKKMFANTHTYTQDHPYSIVIKATDNFDNTAHDTFKIVFDPSYVKKDTTYITIYKLQGDTLRTASNPASLTGTISHSGSKPVNLKATLNDSPLFDTPFSSGSGVWSQACPLQQGQNNLTLKAFSETGVLLTIRSLSIVYNSATADNTPPILLPPLVNDIESERHYVASSSAQLSFMAYDYESGIKSIIINRTDTLSVTPGQFLWRKTISNIRHEWESVFLEISDFQGNTTFDTIRVCYNRLPIAKPSELPYGIEINKVYTEEISLFDPDNDTMRVIPVKIPPDLVFSDNNTQFSWLPNSEHIGADTLIFQIYDRFQTSEQYIWPFMIFDPSLVNLSVSLADSQNIPEFLKALQDTLHISTTLGVPSGTPPYTYRIQILKKSGFLDSSSDDGIFAWTPDTADVGECQIRLYVEDGLKHSDTLISDLLIVYPNSDEAQLNLKSMSGATWIDSGNLFLTEPDSTGLLTFEIVDKDHPVTENYDVTVTIDGVTTKFSPAEKLFQFSIVPPSFNIDSVLFTLKDNTRLHPCSLQYIIINPVSDPTLISGLEHWYKPENLTSTFFSITWKDQLSTNNNFTANDGVSSIMNGLNNNTTVKLSSSYLTNPEGGNWMADPFTIFILAKYDSLLSSSQTLIANFNPNMYSSFSLGLSAAGEVIAFTNSTMFSNTAKTSLRTDKNTWYIYSFRSSGIEQNNSITVTAGINRSFENVTIMNVPDEFSMSIGSHNRTTNKWSGELADILHYNRSLSSAECRSVIGYLMDRYGLR